MNHSCKPNTYFFSQDERIFLVALKNIKPGNILSVDYGYSELIND